MAENSVVAVSIYPAPWITVADTQAQTHGPDGRRAPLLGIEPPSLDSLAGLLLKANIYMY